MIPTVGFNMRKITKGNVTIKLWDIGGQVWNDSVTIKYNKAEVILTLPYLLYSCDSTITLLIFSAKIPKHVGEILSGSQCNCLYGGRSRSWQNWGKHSILVNWSCPNITVGGGRDTISRILPKILVFIFRLPGTSFIIFWKSHNWQGYQF